MLKSNIIFHNIINYKKKTAFKNRNFRGDILMRK